MTEKDLVQELTEARELMEALIVDLPEGNIIRARQEAKINRIKARLADINR